MAVRVRLMLSAVLVMSLIGGAPSAAAPTAAAPSLDDCTTLRSAGESTEQPVGTGACPGVRPGALVTTEDVEGARWDCTLGFAFEGIDPRDGTSVGRFISTAGTCALPWQWATVWADGEGPRAFDADGNLVGHYVYAYSDIDNAGREFALIKVAPGVDVNPQVCYFGGPTAPAPLATDGPLQLRYVGQGSRGVLPGRSSVSLHGYDNQIASWTTGSWLQGDTGGPVMTADGAALGSVAAGGAMTSQSPDVGTLLITRLHAAVKDASRDLGIDLELMTAPLL